MHIKILKVYALADKSLFRVRCRVRRWWQFRDHDETFTGEGTVWYRDSNDGTMVRCSLSEEVALVNAWSAWALRGKVWHEVEPRL